MNKKQIKGNGVSSIACIHQFDIYWTSLNFVALHLQCTTPLRNYKYQETIPPRLIVRCRKADLKNSFKTRFWTRFWNYESECCLSSLHTKRDRFRILLFIYLR